MTVNTNDPDFLEISRDMGGWMNLWLYENPDVLRQRNDETLERFRTQGEAVCLRVAKEYGLGPEVIGEVKAEWVEKGINVTFDEDGVGKIVEARKQRRRERMELYERSKE